MNLLETAASLGIEGFLHPAELEKLAELALDRDVLEIGSYRGLSAWGMAITAKCLTCVDTFRAATNGQRQTEELTTLEDFDRAVAHYRHVKRKAATSEEASRHLTGEQFDMIFLDAMHTYDEVSADIERWRPAVRSGGLLVLHDYGHGDFPDVKRAADELLGEPDGVLVTLAWWQL